VNNTLKAVIAATLIFGSGVLTGVYLVKPRLDSKRPDAPVNLSDEKRVVFVNQLDRQLSLKESQKRRINEILTQSNERTRALWEPIADQMRDELSAVREAIRAELTPGQQARFDQQISPPMRLNRLPRRPKVDPQAEKDRIEAERKAAAEAERQAALKRQRETEAKKRAEEQARRKAREEKKKQEDKKKEDKPKLPPKEKTQEQIEAEKKAAEARKRAAAEKKRRDEARRKAQREAAAKRAAERKKQMEEQKKRDAQKRQAAAAKAAEKPAPAPKPKAESKPELESQPRSIRSLRSR